MSKVKAARTEASSGDQSSRAFDLSNLIDTKLDQANGICGVIRQVEGVDPQTADSIWAMNDLIDEAKKAAEELWQIYRNSQPEWAAVAQLRGPVEVRP